MKKDSGKQATTGARPRYGSSMGKGGPQRRVPLTQGGPAVVIALDDDLDADTRAKISSLTAQGLLADVPVVIVSASELSDPDRESDFYFGAYRPTTPDCEKVLEFSNGGTFTAVEQDQKTGAVYRGGQQVWPTAPIAVERISSRTSRGWTVSDYALLFADGPRMRVTTIPDVFIESGAFATRPLQRSEAIPDKWVEVAKSALQRRNAAPRHN